MTILMPKLLIHAFKILFFEEIPKVSPIKLIPLTIQNIKILNSLV